MLTRCPECGTTFRITPEQLKMRSGRVRCGACQRVFDALETLAEEAAAAKGERTPSPPAAVPPGHAAAAEDGTPPVAPEQAPAQVAQRAEEAAEGLSAEDAGVEAARIDPESSAPGTPHARIAVEEGRGPADEPKAVPAEAAAPERFAAETPAPPEPHRSAEQPRRPRTWPWALGVCAAVLALAVQALLHFRTELAVLYPETRPLLVSACDALGCKLERPRKPELVGIEASDLSVADGSLALTATLRNRAPFAQEYPHLELTLTDTADRALVRRVLAPTEYLLPQTSFETGFGARAEAAVSLAVTTRDVAAAGYRLYLFYP